MPTQAASGGRRLGLGNFLEGHTDRQEAFVDGGSKDGLDVKDEEKMPRYRRKKHGYEDITDNGIQMPRPAATSSRMQTR